MKPFTRLFSVFLPALATVVLSGCGESPQYETTRGLQEENQVLKDQIAQGQSQIEMADKESSERIEQLKIDYANQLASKDELHREKIANLENELNGMRLRLGAAERETLTLREIVDGEPRVTEAIKARNRDELWVFAVLLGVLVSLNGLFIWKYKSVSDRLNLLTMKQVGELRRIGGEV